MAWAEDQSWFGMEDYLLERRSEAYENLRNRLNSYYHIDREGKTIDVRTIDAGYASNLYNWYMRKNLMSIDQLKETVMIKELERIKGDKND